MSSFETTVTCFLLPPENALSFLAATDELPPIENLVPEGRFPSCPIALAVTLTFAVPGVVPENISPAADAMVTDLSKVNSSPPGDLIFVPLSYETLELALVQ